MVALAIHIPMPYSLLGPTAKLRASPGSRQNPGADVSEISKLQTDEDAKLSLQGL